MDLLLGETTQAYAVTDQGAHEGLLSLSKYTLPSPLALKQKLYSPAWGSSTNKDSALDPYKLFRYLSDGMYHWTPLRPNIVLLHKAEEFTGQSVSPRLEHEVSSGQAVWKCKPWEVGRWIPMKQTCGVLRLWHLSGSELNQNHILRKPWGKFMALLPPSLKKHNILIINLIFHFCKMKSFYGWLSDPQKMLTEQEGCKWETQFCMCWNHWTRQLAARCVSQVPAHTSHTPRRCTVWRQLSSHRHGDPERLAVLAVIRPQIVGSKHISPPAIPNLQYKFQVNKCWVLSSACQMRHPMLIFLTSSQRKKNHIPRSVMSWLHKSWS